MKEKIINALQIFTPLILGSVTGILIKNAIDFQNLIKPPLAPPSFIFPIAWTILYFLMGVSYYLYKKEYNNTKINILYYLQLFFNLSWTIFFFILKWRLFSIFWILLLIFFVFKLILNLKKEKKISAYLLVPYFLWLIFATYLNIGIYLLN